MRSKIWLFVLYSFLAEPAFCWLFSSNLMHFSLPLHPPRLSLWSDTSLHMSLTQNILWLDLFWFCLILYWVKRMWQHPVQLLLILFACSLLHVAWSKNFQIPFGERNLLFKCTVGGTYDLRERFKPSATTLTECLSPCSPALAVLIRSRMSWCSSQVSNK